MLRDEQWANGIPTVPPHVIMWLLAVMVKMDSSMQSGEIMSDCVSGLLFLLDKYARDRERRALRPKGTAGSLQSARFIMRRLNIYSRHTTRLWMWGGNGLRRGQHRILCVTSDS